MKDYIIPFLTSLGFEICIILMDKLIFRTFTVLEHILFFILIILIGVVIYFSMMLFRYKKFGISAIQKSETHFNLKKQLSCCEKSLYFMGLSARIILTAEAGKVITKAFAKNNHLSLKFLLFDPREKAKGRQKALDGTGDENNWDNLWKNLILSSIGELSVLKKNHRNSNIEVRIYKDFPIFRFLIVDDSTIYMNYYGKGFAPSEIPNLMIKKNRDGFYQAIEKYFECLWNSSEIILDNQTNKLENLKREVN
jgi:hypothetical protein